MFSSYFACHPTLTSVLCWYAVKLPTMSSVSPNEPTILPLELKEMMLMKGVAALYKLLGVRLMPRADFVSLITMVTVCFEWYIIITGRKFNLHQLRQMFRKTVFRCKMLLSFHLQAIVNNKCYQLLFVPILERFSYNLLFCQSFAREYRQINYE